MAVAGKQMGIQFPLFVCDPDDPTSLHIVESLDAAEGGEIEESDVEDDNLVFWDATGLSVLAAVRRTGRHWLDFTTTGKDDVASLREALRTYAAAVEVPPEDVETLSPADAVKKLEEAAERQRGPRRWYQFWRRH